MNPNPVHELLDEKPAPEQGLNRYDDAKGDDQKWGKITKIVVPTEEDKKQLLLASEYIHYLGDIDSDYMMVNTLMHLYEHPDWIEVQST